MAHEIDETLGRPAIAFVGQVPWHGLGTELPKGQPLEVWADAAGLSWQAERSPLFRSNGRGALTHVAGRDALYRSDTGMDLGIVSKGYQVVQPRDVLEFYRSLTESMGVQLEVAGALSGGKRVWALARTGENMILPGSDEVRGYVLLATSYDGTMATVATRTSVRVVCNNTLSLAVGSNGQKADVRIPHHSTFSADQVKGQLGLENNAAWEQFQVEAAATAARKVSREDALRFFMSVLYPEDATEEQGGALLIDSKAKLRQIEVLEGLRIGAVGQHTLSANDTAWGLVNAVTYFVDFSRGERKVWEYRRSEIRGAGTYTDDGGLTGCDGGGSETIVSGAGYILRGGYAWSGNATPEIYIGTVSVQRKYWTLTGCGEIIDATAGTSQWSNITNGWASVSCGDTVIDQIAASAPGLEPEFQALGVNGGWAISQSLGDYSAFQINTDVADGGGGQVAVYLTGSPDALWTLNGIATSGMSVRSRQWDTDNVPCVYRLDYMALYKRPTEPRDDVYRRGLYTGRPSHSWIGTGTPTADSTVTDGAGESGSNLCYINGSEEYSGDTDQSAWSGVTGNGSEPGSIGLYAMVSAQGAAIYQQYPEATLSALSWDGDIPDSSGALAWIGGI